MRIFLAEASFLASAIALSSVFCTKDLGRDCAYALVLRSAHVKLLFTISCSSLDLKKIRRSCIFPCFCFQVSFLNEKLGQHTVNVGIYQICSLTANPCQQFLIIVMNGDCVSDRTSPVLLIERGQSSTKKNFEDLCDLVSTVIRDIILHNFLLTSNSPAAPTLLFLSSEREPKIDWENRSSKGGSLATVSMEWLPDVGNAIRAPVSITRPRREKYPASGSGSSTSEIEKDDLCDVEGSEGYWLSLLLLGLLWGRSLGETTCTRAPRRVPFVDTGATRTNWDFWLSVMIFSLSSTRLASKSDWRVSGVGCTGRTIPSTSATPASLRMPSMAMRLLQPIIPLINDSAAGSEMTKYLMSLLGSCLWKHSSWSFSSFGT